MEVKEEFAHMSMSTNCGNLSGTQKSKQYLTNSNDVFCFISVIINYNRMHIGCQIQCSLTSNIVKSNSIISNPINQGVDGIFNYQK